jgi:exodeoxyribonuclease-3
MTTYFLQEKMKIATWNVNSIRTRQEQVLSWLKSNCIDVLCLQETKVIDSDFPRQNFEDLGYHLYISGQKSYNGVAIFSKQALENVLTGFSPLVNQDSALIFDQQKRVISGIINNLRIINLYVPNGSAVGSDKYEYKLNWLKVCQDFLQKLQTKESLEICICGDFNIALEDKDIYNPEGKENHIMASHGEREGLNNILAIGLEDAFRKFTLEGGHFTWWDYRHLGFQKNRGWRIDHFYLTSKLYQKALNCYIDINPRKLVKPSDHAPVILEL